jgi:DNA-3-methyladenine glycosylase II
VSDVIHSAGLGQGLAASGLPLAEDLRMGRPPPTSTESSARQPSYSVSPGDAARILAERDPVIRRLVEEFGPPVFPKPQGTHFASLVQSITFQQLAGGAARAIHQRLVQLLHGEVTPERILETSPSDLRSAGLSNNKVASIVDLATKVADHSLSLDGRRLARESDSEIASQLTSVRGIGKWTADLFLMFRLRRMDIWPVGDLAVRRGYGLAWHVEMPTSKELERLGEPLRPYRSIAAYYCWHATRLLQ